MSRLKPSAALLASKPPKAAPALPKKGISYIEAFDRVAVELRDNPTARQAFRAHITANFIANFDAHAKTQGMALVAEAGAESFIRYMVDQLPK